MKSELIKDIILRIKTELPEIVFIDLYHEQDRYSQKNYPFPLPAILFELQNIDWQNTTFRVQTGICTIRVHILTDKVLDTFDTAEKHQQAIDEIMLTEKVWAALEGLESPWYSKLNRKRELYSGHFIIDFQTTINQKIEKVVEKQKANLIINKL